MAAPMLCSKLLNRFSHLRSKSHLFAVFCSSNIPGNTHTESNSAKNGPEVNKVLQAFEKFDRIAHEVNKDETDDVDSQTEYDKNETFASMLRRSKLLQIGKPDGKIVDGTIIEVQGDDLYIDFGGKFHCVCPRPMLHTELYFRGEKVRILLKDLEMSSAFLGSSKHITLLEADAVLLGLKKKKEQQMKKIKYDKPAKTETVSISATTANKPLIFKPGKNNEKGSIQEPFIHKNVKKEAKTSETVEKEIKPDENIKKETKSSENDKDK